MLIPPKTDFTNAQELTSSTSYPSKGPKEIKPEFEADSRSDYIAIRVHPSSQETEKKTSTSPSKSKQPAKKRVPTLDPALARAVEDETEWSGIFLKKIREAYHISLEEMASTTKVSKTYIIALEEENFNKLPASVYIRGFITQIAKVLKLSHEKVATAYIARYNRSLNK